MKVKELKEALSKYPDDAIVFWYESKIGLAGVKLVPFVNIDGIVTNVYIEPKPLKKK